MVDWHPAKRFLMKQTAYTLSLITVFLLFIQAHRPGDYAVGDRVEDFSLMGVDGQYVSLKNYPSAKGFFVIFTCNHCPYAQLYEQRIIELHKKYAPKGYPVIAINPNDPEIVPEDSFEEMQKRAKAKRYPFAYAFDADQTVFRVFGATRTPHVFLLDADYVVRYIGAIDDNPELAASAQNKFAENAVEALLRGERPTLDFTRAVGCKIKYRAK